MPAANMAKELAKTTLPMAARPAAVPIMLDSATPMLKKRFGKAWAKVLVRVEPERSASRTMISGLSFPSSASATP